MRSTLLILMAIWCLSVNAQYDVYDTEKFFSTAQKYTDKDSYDEAIKIYNLIEANDPQYIEAKLKICYILIAQNKYKEAIDILLPLYEEGRFKEDPQLFVTLGSAYSNNEELKKAEDIYLQGEKLSPDYGTLMYNLAVLYRKMENLDKTVHYIKRTLNTNPNISSAHYILSSLAYENGQIALGSLAAAAYLSISPSGRYAGDMILKLNEKMGSNFLDESDFKFSEKGDDFSDLQFILRNEFPLDKKYKLKCEIDDIFTRNLQAVVEYAADHKVNEGYFEKIYIPYLADIAKKGYVEHFQYWALSSLTGEIEKEIIKQKKKLVEFSDNYYQNYYWELFSKRTLNHFNEVKDVNIYLDNGLPYLICETIDGKYEGFAKFIDEYGRMSAKVFYKNSEAQGKAEYFNSNRNVTETRNYEDSKIQGENIYLNDNGKTIAVYNYEDGLLNGNTNTYYDNGDEKCTVYYSNGELDGAYKCHYENGQQKFVLNYKKGKLNGQRLAYNPDGTLITKEIYKNDLYNGSCTYFNPINGKELSKIDYKDGEVTKSYSRKNNAGIVNFEFVKNGELEEFKRYENGSITSIQYFKGDQIIKTDFYEGEKIYLTHNYKKEQLSSIIQYTVNIPKGKKIDLANARIYQYDGSKMSDLVYKDGKLNGLCKYYYPNGNKRSEKTFVNGKETGHSKYWSKNGNRTSEYHAISDTLNGLYISYTNGKKTSEYYYKNGDANGPYKTYYSNGKLQYSGFFISDDEHGKTIKHSPDGSVLEVQEYQYGDLIKRTYYNKDGKIDTVLDYTQEGPQKIIYKSVSYTDKFTLKNGKINGIYDRIDSSGDTIFSLNYINGSRNGICKYYKPTGKLSSVKIQNEGKYYGDVRYFDHAGLKSSDTKYLDNDENGVEIYYYPNGKKRSEHTNFEDKLEGEQTIYNMQGVPIAKLSYEEGLIRSYWVIGQDAAKIMIKEKNKIEGKYNNGQTAISFVCNKMCYDGEFQIYSEDGVRQYLATYKNGYYEGDRVSYKENGQKHMQTTYLGNLRHGETIYYDNDENVLIKYETNYGNYNGNYEIYKNGILIKTKTYFDDQLIEIR